MKVYISADIEGVTGATHWDETDQKNAFYGELREQMTAEVAAACEGALQAGGSEIWVKDAHDSARNIIAAKLPREVRLVREWSEHPFGMMQELDETFHAALMIGYHSRAGSNGSPLAHTMTGNMIHIAINGQYASEFVVSAYTAGLVGVPVVFLSGDAALCQEAQGFLPGLSTVAVQHGVGNSTASIHPHLAVERIRSGVEAALRGDLSKCRVPGPDRFSVELRYRKHADAYRASFYPGVRAIDSHTVGFEAEDYFEVLRFLLFCVV